MEIGTVQPAKIEDELTTSYLEYAMSVIVSRALPDIRDGLKPVQRRILYGMDQLGIRANTGHKKSARIVGEVLGKYHPHGDASVYDTMVRLAQVFSMRYVLVDGQGNFGSMDNDPAAAMRYTEARLSQIAMELLADIEKATVDFVPNFDDSLEEPSVLPTKVPNLLINGSSGIAVSMATNIPPHNLGEICDGIGLLIDNPRATLDDLMGVVKGPDFPTGGIIQGDEGIRKAFAEGQGRIVMRAKAAIEETAKDRLQITVTELPYQTNKSTLMEKIADLAKTKKVEGISELRDESDREGMRIVIELKKEAYPQKVLNNLFNRTSLQSTFSVNFLALVDEQPRRLSLKEALQFFIEFRQRVITRRSRFDLKQAQSRAHILEGLKTALDNIDEVIRLIRASKTVETAREGLREQFKLSEAQAQAILDMALRRLAALEHQKINDEFAELLKTIAFLEDLLANPRKILFIIKEEVAEIKEKYGDPRRTLIIGGEVGDFSVEDLVPHEETVVTVSQRGYVKRVPGSTYRVQQRGGRGIMGMGTRDIDEVRHVVVADTHDHVLFFTNRGKVFRLKCHELPAEASRTARGTPIVNVMAMDSQDRITAIVKASDLAAGSFLVLATTRGEVKKTAAEEFATVRSSGLIAMDLEEGDELVSALFTRNEDDVIMVSAQGKAIRFGVEILRSASRTSGGVRGMRVGLNERVVSMGAIAPDAFLLTMTENGFGKLTPLSAFPRKGRGGMGMLAFRIGPKSGDVVAAEVVFPSQELMVVTERGIVLRTAVGGEKSKERIAIQGRTSQGVSVKDLDPGDKVVSIAFYDGPAAKEASRNEDSAPQ